MNGILKMLRSVDSVISLNYAAIMIAHCSSLIDVTGHASRLPRRFHYHERNITTKILANVIIGAYTYGPSRVTRYYDDITYHWLMVIRSPTIRRHLASDSTAYGLVVMINCCVGGGGTLLREDVALLISGGHAVNGVRFVITRRRRALYR